MINTIIISLSAVLLSILLSFTTANIILLAFTIPIIGWDVKIANFILPISDIAALLVLISTIITISYIILFKPAVKIKGKLLLFFPFILFIAAYSISLINHPHPLEGLYYISRWLVLLYLAYVLTPNYLIDSTKKLKISIWSLALISLLMTLSGYISIFAKDWHNSFFRLDAIAIFGVYPFGKNHNLIAEFLSVSAFFWLALKDFYNDIKIKKILNILFILTLMASILTFSRAAWITVIIQLIIFLYWTQKHNFKKYAALWLLSILSIIILAIPILWRMQILQQENTSSTENRWLLTEIAYSAWKDKPIIGNGAGQFVNLVDNNIRFKAKYGDPIDSHGFLQKIIAEAGILGLITWLFLLMVIINRAYLAIKKYHKTHPYILALWVGALGGIIFQVFNTSYFKGKVWLPIIIALIATELADKKYGKKN